MPETADRLLSSKDLLLRVGWTRQHVMREERAGRFPKRIQVGPNTVRWSEAEVTAWIEQKKAQRSQPAKGA